jgi:4-hydroxy-3-methylbut-2-en-1-yl diphosphate synthase IspG/GcpE
MSYRYGVDVVRICIAGLTAACEVDEVKEVAEVTDHNVPAPGLTWYPIPLV